jgi:hypothetical protein
VRENLTNILLRYRARGYPTPPERTRLLEILRNSVNRWALVGLVSRAFDLARSSAGLIYIDFDGLTTINIRNAKDGRGV